MRVSYCFVRQSAKNHSADLFSFAQHGSFACSFANLLIFDTMANLEPIWWSNVNHVSDEILCYIFKRDRIEDIISKERVSKRFGETTNNILSMMKTLKSCTDKFDLSKGLVTQQRRNEVFQLMKRMPKLDDGLIIYKWDIESLTQLAAINQSMCRKRIIPSQYPEYTPDPGYVSYIEGIKVIDPQYDGKDVEFVFPYADVTSLIDKYPEMKLKSAMWPDQINSKSSATANCYSLRSLDLVDGENIHRVLPSVKHVSMCLSQFYLDSLPFRPNISSITINESKRMPRINMSCLLPLLHSQLQHLDIDMVKVDRKDFPALRHIFDTQPLVTFRCCITSDHAKEEVIAMILESPLNGLKKIRMESLRLSYSYRSLDIEETDWSNISGLMQRILIKFRWITNVSFDYVMDDDKIRTITDIFGQIENADRRRSLMAISKKEDYCSKVPIICSYHGDARGH